MLTNKRGNAALEVIGIFAVIMILFNFGLGFYGVIQTGILKSMAARNYTLETFRFRSNLDFFWRLGSDNGGGLSRYRRFGNRFHGITSENSNTSDKWAATARPIAFGSSFGGTDAEGVEYHRVPGSDGNARLHNEIVYEIKDDGKPLLEEKDKYRAFPVWIKTVYGICINANCAPIK